MLTFTNDGELTNELTNILNAGTDGATKSMTLVVTLDDVPAQTHTITFDLTFVDLCHIAVLSLSDVSTPTNGELWSESSVSIGTGVSDDINRNCGVTTFILKDENGNAVVGDVFSLTSSAGNYLV